MRVMALFSTSFFVGEDGPGRGHLCHTDTFLVSNTDKANTAEVKLNSAQHWFSLMYVSYISFPFI